MLNSMVSLVFGFLFMSACNNKAATETKKQEDLMGRVTDTIPPAKTTAEVDSNGCKIGEGEKWSVVKKACILLTATGIKLEPQGPKLDKTKPAYLIFSDDRIRVEIILPTQKKPVIIRKTSATDEPEKWSSGPLTLLLAEGVYSLDDEGKLLYQGPASD